MRILVGNNHLVKTGGTENYTFTLAMELKRQGHDVEYICIDKGRISELLEENGISFMKSPYYDLILVNHTTIVERVWKLGYTIQTCHGYIPTLEHPSVYADSHVSITKEVSGYVKKKGYDSEVILNGIDCNRFCPKREVSEKLTSVLSLCQSDEANEFIRNCCEELGVRFLSCNKYTDNVWQLEDIINEADLVVGIGRSVYDAMACGRCVISFDYRDYMGEAVGDGFLTEENIEDSITCNCTGRSLRKKFTKEQFIAELKRYSPQYAKWVREYALENLNISHAVKRYIEMCGQNGVEKKIERIIALDNERYYALQKQKENEISNLNSVIGEVRKTQEELTTRCSELENTISLMRIESDKIRKKNNKHLKWIRILTVSCLVFLFLAMVSFFMLCL